jgi:hypothetical protein
MRKPLMALALVATAGFPLALSAAPTEQNFLVRTTRDLVDLCAAGQDSPMMTAAVNFCQGYLVGAFQVLRTVDAARGERSFCIPTPPPSRNQAIADFIRWGNAHSEAMSLPAADGFYQFLTQRFPCPAAH